MKYARFYIPLLLIILTKISLEPLFKQKGLGSEGNPIRIMLTPSVDAQKITSSADRLIEFLEKNTNYKFSLSVPTSYITVVEAFGSRKADLAALNTFSYILAHDRYGAEASLRIVRRGGETSYKGQIIARSDSGIDSLYELSGKKVAYVDPASTSGYILPKALLSSHNIRPSDEVFAQKHDNVVTMVYQRQVDAGATFYSPPDAKTGEILDARARVAKQFPDIFSKVKILALTASIPNDPFAFRKDFPEDMKQAIIKALIDFQSTPEGRQALYEIYSVEGLMPTSDADYDELRAMIRKFGGDLENALRN